MAEITLLRHGQASFGEENYDRLSNIGHRQALWLGEHFKKLDQNFDRIVMGTMVRHEETAKGVLKGLGRDIPLETHAGFNEYDFGGLLGPLKELHSDKIVKTDHARRDYYYNMKLALTCWMNGSIDNDGQDTWESFCKRIVSGFAFACDGSSKRTLVVTSGGPISVIAAEILSLDHERTCKLTLQIKNSSTTKFLFRRPFNGLNEFTMDSFNDISHLQTEDKRHSITFS